MDAEAIGWSHPRVQVASIKGYRPRVACPREALNWLYPIVEGDWIIIFPALTKTFNYFTTFRVWQFQQFVPILLMSSQNWMKSTQQTRKQRSQLYLVLLQVQPQHKVDHHPLHL
jgi:hypothetical protein